VQWVVPEETQLRLWVERKHISIRDALDTPAPLKGGKPPSAPIQEHSGVERDLELQLDKTHQSSYWGSALTPPLNRI
jgi:hypothetical protein